MFAHTVKKVTLFMFPHIYMLSLQNYFFYFKEFEHQYIIGTAFLCYRLWGDWSQSKLSLGERQGTLWTGRTFHYKWQKYFFNNMIVVWLSGCLSVPMYSRFLKNYLIGLFFQYFVLCRDCGAVGRAVVLSTYYPVFSLAVAFKEHHLPWALQ